MLKAAPSVLPANSCNFQALGIAGWASSGSTEHLSVPWTCLSVQSLDVLLSGVSHNLMYMLQAISFHIQIEFYVQGHPFSFSPS